MLSKNRLVLFLHASPVALRELHFLSNSGFSLYGDSLLSVQRLPLCSRHNLCQLQAGKYLLSNNEGLFTSTTPECLIFMVLEISNDQTLVWDGPQKNSEDEPFGNTHLI